MSEKRIGKLERWVLIHTYKKSMNELPKGWKGLEKRELRESKSELEREVDSFCKGTDDIEREADEMKRTCLNKDEILLNYFDNLEISTVMDHYGGNMKECFSTTNQYKSALVILSRTIKRMTEKGLIEIRRGEYNIWTFIELTHAGKLVAERYC